MTSKIRYIGRAKNPQQRFNNHLTGVRKLINEICPETDKIRIDCDCKIHITRNETNSSRYWIANLKKKNLQPNLVILEKVEPSFRIAEREMRWISFFIQQKAKLVNTENQCPEIQKLIRSQKSPFLEIPLKSLTKNGFIQEFYSLLFKLFKYSDWQYAEFINALYDGLKIEPIKKFSI